MGYIDADRKKHFREKNHTAIITRVRSSMKPPQDFDLESDGCPSCFWGQRLTHEHFNWDTQTHLYVRPEKGQTCNFCPFSGHCPQEFSFSPTVHETYLGAQPLHTMLAQKLLQFARPIVEANFSEDKNRFMLKTFFINSLNLAEFVSLLVDSARLLTVIARLKTTRGKQLKTALDDLMIQLELPLF